MWRLVPRVTQNRVMYTGGSKASQSSRIPQVNFLLRALIEPDADKKVLCEPAADTALVVLVQFISYGFFDYEIEGYKGNYQ